MTYISNNRYIFKFNGVYLPIKCGHVALPPGNEGMPSIGSVSDLVRAEFGKFKGEGLKKKKLERRGIKEWPNGNRRKSVSVRARETEGEYGVCCAVCVKEGKSRVRHTKT